MDPAAIAAGAVALLAPYFKKAAEAFAGEAGKYVQEKAKGLWQKLRSRLDGDPPAKEVLDRFEADPAAHQEALREKLTEKVSQDPSLSGELSSELSEIKRSAPYVRVVMEMKEAENLTAARVKKLKAGTVDASVKVDKVTGSAVGADIDEMG